VDLFARQIRVHRSKTEAGRRDIPLNADAMAAIARLRERAEAANASQPEHFVFPACENDVIDATRPQRTWRSAWRSLVRSAAKRAGDAAARTAEGVGADPAEARGKAMSPFQNLRFHDLRHQSISELAEAGASDAVIMSVAGHMSRQMMEHYSHVRMAAKRSALDALSSGPIASAEHDRTKAVPTVQ
jgi:integrase